MALAGLTSACRVDVRVGVEADPAGGGEVRVAAHLDPSAVEELVGQAAGDPATSDPATRIKVEDLRKAGWTVDGPTRAGDGGLDVVARHRFADDAGARTLVAQVAGDPGPFRDVQLTQERGFFTTTTRFRGTVDLAAGLGSFTDAALRDAIGATPEAPLGVTQAQLEQRFGAPLDQLVGLRVDVRLPGRVETNGPSAGAEGAVWMPKLGEALVVEATGKRTNVANIAALVLAVVAALALLAGPVRRLVTRPPAPEA